jgi:endonuclease G
MAMPLDVAHDATRPPSYYDGYVGYDPAFLGTGVPLPPLTGEQRRAAATRTDARPGDDPVVLPYTHFSVVVNRLRQLALYTVVNIDGDDLTDLGRSADRWFLDPRIAESEQIGEDLYRRNALDRGHLVRRLDPVWGADPQRPNDDTFHFTNCSPQHERFNQGQDLWQGLENYILDNAGLRRRRITVFTGPVLADDDPLYKGVRLPLAFWKIIAYDRADETLVSAGYVLEQAKLIDDMLGARAAFEPGTYRVTLDELRRRTGLDFDHLLPHELPVSDSGLDRAAAPRIRVRDDYSNLVL